MGFDNYFINGVYGYLRIKDMRKTIEDGLENSRETIDTWFGDGVKKTDYCLFLEDIIRENFASKEQYLNYVKIYMYVVIHHRSKMLSWSKGKILERQYAQEILNTSGISEKEYTKHLLGLLNRTDWDPLMKAQRELTSELIGHDNEYFIKYSELYQFVKQQFYVVLEDASINEEEKYSYLLSCLTIGGRYRSIDEECRSKYRKYITKYPNWYVANFVRLGMQSSSPEFNSITCEPFWSQIFGSISEMYSYLFWKKNDTTPNIKRARNFWRLFKANEYKPIEFDRQGNVQEKIDNDLVEEIKQLEELEQLKQDVKTLRTHVKSNKLSAKQAQLRIGQLDRKLSKILLYVRLNGKIHEEIDKLKGEL